MNKKLRTLYVQIQKSTSQFFVIQYRISQQINQIFEILGLYCFAFTALTIDKTFTQRNFLPSKIEIVFSNKNLRTNEAENS